MKKNEKDIGKEFKHCIQGQFYKKRQWKSNVGVANV